MMVLEHDAVEIDYCPSCGGIWLDAGEIELLFGDAARCAAFIQGGVPAPAPGEVKRRCPICGKKMAKTATQGAHPITYDECVRGHGLWFDKGELADVLARGVTEPDGHRVAEFLRGVFPQHKA